MQRFRSELAEREGMGDLPVCVRAGTQQSVLQQPFRANPAVLWTTAGWPCTLT